MQEIIELEYQGWEALSTEGDLGVEFYSSLLRENAVMVFPGGIFIEGKENILASLDAEPWSTFKIEDSRVTRLADDAVILTYRVNAQRGGTDPYEALVSSTYVSVEGEWKLAHHQHSIV